MSHEQPHASKRRKGAVSMVTGAGLLLVYLLWSLALRRHGLITPFLPAVAIPAVVFLYFGVRTLSGGTGETRAMRRMDRRMADALERQFGLHPEAVGWFELDLDYLSVSLRRKAEQLPMRVEKSRPNMRSAILALADGELMLFGAQLAAFTGVPQLWELGRWPARSVTVDRIGPRGMNSRIVFSVPRCAIVVESFDYLGTQSTADFIAAFETRSTPEASRVET